MKVNVKGEGEERKAKKARMDWTDVGFRAWACVVALWLVFRLFA